VAPSHPTPMKCGCLLYGFRKGSLRQHLVITILGLALGGRATAQTFTTLYSFTGGNDGYGPNGLVLGRDGGFYGTTVNGGTNSAGTVFKINPSGTLTSLYSFTGTTDGANPAAGLVQGSDGYFYGTTQSGGNPSDGPPGGTVFKIGTNGALTSLYSFTASTAAGDNDGSAPKAGLVQGSDGNFYGTTFGGGWLGPFMNIGPNGIVFKISTHGNLTSYFFTTPNDTPMPVGANPAAGVVQGSDSFFYGTTQSGGKGNAGTVFKFDPNATWPISILYSFTGGNDGGGPLAGLVQGSDGFFYGTTPDGGKNSMGTVFKINPSEVLTTLYSFNSGNDGANPAAGLVQGSDGYFYGTTQIGGTNGGEGTIFRIGSTGDYTSLYSFSGGGDGSNPQSALVQASDGSFYGTTANGGSSGAGTVFRLTVPLGLPKLAILPAGTNVVLMWTNTASGFTLQSTTNLASPAWNTNLPSPVIVNGFNTVTNPISASQQFYRLSQ
jgi:uncharacterized repeat protein (TIGR03803 family)